MSDVHLSNVRKSFGATEVIHGVSVDIADGRFVVLVGPSGCGKSTLLRMIAGLEDASAGEIRIGGRLVNDVPPRDRDVAMVFQNYALYPHMTVAANMGFSLRMRGERKDVIDRKVRDAAATLGLNDYLDRLPRQLSGGQRQRVAMGRSMVRAPRVFLFDEPLSNLDAQLRVQMRAEIKDLHQRLRTTTVYVTHDQMEAMTLADLIVVLRDGRVEQIGSPLELYDMPANLFVAGFIGSPAMNRLDGGIEVSHAGMTFRSSIGTGISLAGRLAPAPLPARVTLGIRPERIAFAPGGLPATVLVVEQTGSETLVLVRLGDTRVMVVSRTRVTLAPGQAVGLSLPPDAVHLFDSETGRRLPG
jgi:multiple sugar transport system ATP-binding protein